MASTSETALTARNGKHTVDGVLVARTTQWQVSPTLATKSEWGDSDSLGYTNRAAGRRDCTYTTEGKFDTEDEVWDLFQPEDIVQSTLFLNASSPLLYWDFPRALCTDFGLTVNVDSEEVIGWNSSFGADGPFYRPGQPAQTGPPAVPAAPSRTLPT